MTLGERFKFVRKNNELNQKEFAQRLGISQAHVSKIENGSEKPSETLLLFVSYLFAINIEWLKDECGTPQQNDGNCFNKFDRIRKQMEDSTKYMNSDTMEEYTDCLFYYQKTLSLFEEYKTDSERSSEVYKKIKDIMRHLWLASSHVKENGNDNIAYYLRLQESIIKFIDCISADE